MYLLYVFCSHLGFIRWLQNHLLSCPFKKLTGMDCPGCGFQRSVIALLQGNLKSSLYLYPATIPLFLVTIFVLLDGRLHFDKRQLVKKALFMITATIILSFYIVKLSGGLPVYH
jgi:Protein of unknown function (DUF2752)